MLNDEPSCSVYSILSLFRLLFDFIVAWFMMNDSKNTGNNTVKVENK